MNKIQLTGHIVRDPELKFAPGSGTAVTKFTLAVNRPRFDKNKPQETDFINCVCFGKKAEAIANYVQKGHQFGVSGRLQINPYTDKDGAKRYSTDVVVEDFDFLQQKGGTESVNTDTKNKGYEDLEEVDYSGEIPF